MVLLAWLESFPRNRQWFTIDSTLGEWGVDSSGVPHASVLGRLLFYIFVNELPLALRSKCLLLADDLKLGQEKISSRYTITTAAVRRALRLINGDYTNKHAKLLVGPLYR